MCVSGGLDGDGGVVVLEMGSFVTAVKYLLSRKLWHLNSPLWSACKYQWLINDCLPYSRCRFMEQTVLTEACCDSC